VNALMLELTDKQERSEPFYTLFPLWQFRFTLTLKNGFSTLFAVTFLLGVSWPYSVYYSISNAFYTDDICHYLLYHTDNNRDSKTYLPEPGRCGNQDTEPDPLLGTICGVCIFVRKGY